MSDHLQGRDRIFRAVWPEIEKMARGFRGYGSDDAVGIAQLAALEAIESALLRGIAVEDWAKYVGRSVTNALNDFRVGVKAAATDRAGGRTLARELAVAKRAGVHFAPLAVDPLPEEAADIGYMVPEALQTAPPDLFDGQDDDEGPHRFREALARIIEGASLTQAQLDAVRLVYVRGRTHQEAASQLGIKRPALTRRITRALEALRSAATELGIDLARSEPSSAPDSALAAERAAWKRRAGIETLSPAGKLAGSTEAPESAA